MTSDYNTAIDAPAEGAITLPLSSLLESLLFVADGPVPVAQFAAALESTPRTIEAALDELDAIYQHRGLRIQRDKAGIQLTTAPQTAEAVEKFLGLESLQRLSKPAVETLAIIAYQQPITRPRIEAIRGVNSDGVIKSLLTKGLIEEVGRTEGPGRPVLYGTTPAFLQHFGLSSLTDLPPLDIEAVLAAARITGPESEAAAVLPPEVGTEAVAIEETTELTAEVAEPAQTDAPQETDPELEQAPQAVTQPDAAVDSPATTVIIAEAEPEPEATPEPAFQSEVETEAQSILSVEPELELPALLDELTQAVSEVEVVEEAIVEESGDDEDDDDEDDDDDDDWDEDDDNEDEDDEPDEPETPSDASQELQP